MNEGALGALALLCLGLRGCSAAQFQVEFHGLERHAVRIDLGIEFSCIVVALVHRRGQGGRTKTVTNETYGTDTDNLETNQTRPERDSPTRPISETLSKNSAFDYPQELFIEGIGEHRMRISRVTPFLVGPRPSSDGWSRGQIVVFVKLETNTGLVGWGEAYALGNRQRGTREIIIALGEGLKQLPEVSPRAFLCHVAKPMDSKHPGIDYASAVSAIEIALWDLIGKTTGLPVYALLGGAIVDKVPIYANAWDEPVQTPEAIADKCAMMCSQGYSAVKIYPLRQPTLADAEACVRLTREAVGSDVDIMLDFAVQTDPRRALKAAHLFEPYDPYWIEEPLAGDDLDALAEFRANTNTRITTGERQSGLRHYRNVLDKRAADVLNPDIAGAGGILTMLEISAVADAHSVLISPHCWNSTTVAFLAMLHTCAVMRNAIYAELYYDYSELGAEFASCDYVIENGYASLPRKPGLGIEMNEDALRSLAP